MKNKRQLSKFINKKISMEGDCTEQAVYKWLVEFEDEIESPKN